MERDSSSDVLGAVLLFLLGVPPLATFMYQSNINFERLCCLPAIRKCLCKCFDATCGKCLVACFKAPQATAYPPSVYVSPSSVEIDLHGIERPSSRPKPAPPEWSPSAGAAPPELTSPALPPPTAAPLPIAAPVLPAAVPFGNAHGHGNAAEAVAVPAD